MAAYISIQESPNNDMAVEIPSESDGSLLLSSVAAQFPGAVGLRFKSEAGAWRGCRVEGNVIDAPIGGWGNHKYYVVKQALKRAAGKTAKSGASSEKQVCEPKDPLEKYHIPELMIADLPYSADEESLRDYFSAYGKLDTFKLAGAETGRHKGYGFIKYKTSKGTKKCLNSQHFFHNRQLDVRYTKQSLQMLQMGYGVECMPNDNIPTKLFVGGLPIGTTSGELSDVFSKYGGLKDVYIPPQAKSYGFITFGSVAQAFRAMNGQHEVRGQTIMISTSNAKKNHGDLPPNMLAGNTGVMGLMGQMNEMNQINKQNSQANCMVQFLLENMDRMSEAHKMQAKLGIGMGGYAGGYGKY